MSSLIDQDSKIFLAGHNGMVGSAINRKMVDLGFKNILTCEREVLDLTNQAQVKLYFQNNKIDYVIIAAAKVGGIYANSEYPADFISDNLAIQYNLISESYASGIEGLLFLGSSCIYPKNANQPIKESELLNGILEPTNEPYAIAKIAGIKLCESYNRQHQTDFRSVMPTNLYGQNDNFHKKNSHVLPALIRRFHEAKAHNKMSVKVWGSGLPMREFLHVDDLADACLHLIKIPKEEYIKSIDPMISHINIGTGKDISIKDLARIIKETVGFKGDIVFDPSYPDGVMRKLLDVSKLNNLGWHPKIKLEEGVSKTYQWFLNNTYRN
tara:strand:+ start:4240 stop:5214 length:975 start_codon:yes stop_codon:yes gene_type:complete